MTQDTFVKAFKNFHRYDSKYAFSTWLYTIARRTVYNHYRGARYTEPVDFDIVDDSASPDANAELSDRPVPRWLQRACDRDVIISLELDGHEALTQELSSNPEVERIEPNPYLADRIIRELDEDESTSVLSNSWKEISLGIAACIVVALAVNWAGNRETAESVTIVEHVEESIALNGLASSLVSSQSDWQNPLDEEMDNVMENAMGAIDFLADSFLPSSVSIARKKG